MKSSASEPGLTHLFGPLIFERMSAEGGILLHPPYIFDCGFISHYNSLPASVVPWLLHFFCILARQIWHLPILFVNAGT